MACAGEGVPIPMHNARLAIDHRVFRTGIPLFSFRPVISASVKLNLCSLAGFRRLLSRGVWLHPSLYCGVFRFGRWFNDRWQFQRGRFCVAMMAMVQRLDACGFVFHPQLSVAIFLALILKVFRNRFRCHGRSVAELAPAKLSTLALCQWSAMDGLVDE
jgi:hypothetical protein